MNKTAEMSESDFPEAVNVIRRNIYMDDIIDSFKDLQTAQMIAGQIDNVIGMGNFKVKDWSFSARNMWSEGAEIRRRFAQNSETSVLGLVWDRLKDVLKYYVKLNFSTKKNGVFVKPNVNRLEVIQSIPNKLTKRIVLSKFNIIYDPLGLITPFTISAKMILK